MGLGKMTSNHSLTGTCTKLNNKLVNEYLKHFWCQDEPQANSDSQDSPWPGLGGSHHLPPLQYTLCMATRPAPKCHFVPGLPSGSSKIPTTRIPTTFGAHNFACKPLIEMRSEIKLQPLSRAFQWYVACHLHARTSGRFLTFSDQESNCHFDFQPFF